MKTCFLLIAIQVDGGQERLKETAFNEESIQLWKLTTASQKHFKNLIGVKGHVFEEKIEFSTKKADYIIKNVRLFFLRKQSQIPIRFNYYTVYEISYNMKLQNDDDEIDIQNDILSVLSPRGDNLEIGEIDLNKAVSLFGEKALPLPEKDCISNASVECWCPKREYSDFEIITYMYLYYTICGYSLVSLEHNQIDIKIIKHKFIDDKKILDQLFINKLYIANLNRIFLTSSQSPFSSVRELCEDIMDHYRLRDRASWLRGVYNDISNAYDVVIKRSQARTSRITSRILFALTSFTVLSGLFFGLFELNRESDIVTEGPKTLGDPIYLPPFLISLVALLILILLVAVWPQNQSKRME